ncbi:RagB/SusD family nutrient uptake outer membrane protein [Chitinophaga horti]|uniref:RagB/SusD family nutrient uptake outer membrane protein n=1 Tax=Chitinophaga horti TaxID=2920382 RepID=A0ABY6J1C3_9BACT|nr:RagB/SusD family nutrient uptake outer membrane protein [Chitinophaga horti]UYQ92114.1 RagB/SusD family nutrient uptake outer membrane protein [Chitinophaga horti]
MKKYLILIIAAAATLSSCKKWLDVRPESEVEQDVLFSKEDGFKDAVNGLYSRAVIDNLYGRDLTIALPEVLAQNYTHGARDAWTYRQTSLFNYRDATFIGYRDQIWLGLYNIVANSNIILSYADKKKDVFTPATYAMVKGEALAYRAYCHFDALRLFAPSYLAGANEPGVPYSTVFSNKVPKLYSVKGVIDSVMLDLETARTLLAEYDPIRSPGYKVGYDFATDSSTEARDNQLFTQNRRHRLNYYAVTALMARVALYKGDKANALKYAQEIIDSQKFPWTVKADFVNADEQKRDRIMYKEVIFGLYAPGYLNDRINDLLRRGEDQSLTLSPSESRTIYETGGAGGDDNRYKQWFSEQSGSAGSYMRLEKYKRVDNPNRHPLLIPCIRLSEMYYIAAECTFDTDAEKAWGYFNTVRFNRGIGVELNYPSKEQFMDELMKEARKEFYGEGQIWYMYKRLNVNYPGQSGNVITASRQKFVLPFPDDEIAYGNR